MKRVLTALVFLPVVLGVLLWAPPWSLALLVAVVTLVGVLELDGMARLSGCPLQRWVAAGLGLGACFAFLDPVRAPERILALSCAACLGAVCVALFRGGECAMAGAAATLFAGFYPGVLLSFLVGLAATGGRRMVLFLLLVIWVSDTAAYYGGRAIGRRPLAPRISPRKTVEGALVGLFAAAILAAASRWTFLPEMGGTAPLIGLGLAGIGILGDLAESVLKRGAGVKDASGLLPGHGGVLDRVDSLVLAAPVLYYYHQWVM